MTRVGLTLAQAKQVEWAICPMADYWCTDAGAHSRDGALYADEMLPMLSPLGKTRFTLTLSLEPEINEDLIYRLETQLQQMVNEEGNGARGDGTAARNAVARIRHAIKYSGRATVEAE